jgi:hypothetical protein
MMAAKKLKSDGAFDIEIDQATREEPGSPDIPDTIFKKIDECSIFIADVSFINDKTTGRQTPNPNVLIELGYAIKKIGFEKIILIFNENFGKLEELPFDINHRRPMKYLYNNSMDKKTVLDNLIITLERAILLIDRKTMTLEKVDFSFYGRDEGKQYDKKITISGIVYKILSKEEFLRGIDFSVIRAMKKEMKFTEWQKYLYEKAEIYEQRRAALASIRRMQGIQVISEGYVENHFETKDYYNKYMIASLKWLDTYKFDFFIKNNNEQIMKNIKIILKTDKESRMRREIDLPILPSLSIMGTRVYRPQEDIKKTLFQKKEYGDCITFEYMKENLYADEEFILEESLYIPLYKSDLIKIEYSIFSENLPNIKGELEIKIEKEDKVLTPIDVFLKL